MPTKLNYKDCNLCGKTKPVKDFYKNHKQCKSCFNEKQKEYVKKNAKKIRKYKHEWYEKIKMGR